MTKVTDLHPVNQNGKVHYTIRLQPFNKKLTNLINDTLKLNDAHFRQSSFEKLDYWLKTDALLYELFVVAKQHQCHLQYHFLALEKYQVWHRHNTTAQEMQLKSTAQHYNH